MTHEPAKKLSRKERERERHRREILEAAERVFVRKGYYLATVEQIAQEAQFAVGTIYNFFTGKEELYSQVVEKIAQDFMEVFEQQVLTRSDPEEAIGALIELRLTHFDDHRGFFRVFFETSPGSRLDPPRALPPNCVGLYDRYLDAVSGIFERGITDGLFDEMDSFYLTLCLEGIINAFVAYWSRSEPSEPLATRVDKMRNTFLGRLRVGDPPAGMVCREGG
jgi:AcrR family transcriptional regulator